MRRLTTSLRLLVLATGTALIAGASPVTSAASVTTPSTASSTSAAAGVPPAVADALEARPEATQPAEQPSGAHAAGALTPVRPAGHKAAAASGVVALRSGKRTPIGKTKSPTPPRPRTATGPWIDQTGTVAGLGNEFMFGESCAPAAGARVCIGVGSGQGDDGMSRNGDLFRSGPLQTRSWAHLLSTPLETLDAVSCFDVASPSSLQCHAVGQNGLVLSCHHTASPTCGAPADWTTMHLPTPGGAPFYAVSCPSASLCVAVGGTPGNWLIAYTTTASTDAAPADWTIRAIGTDAGMVPAGVGYLLTVSCPVVGACYAGGENGKLIYLDGPIGGNWSMATVHTTTANIDQIGCGSENTNYRYCFAAVDGAIVGGDTTAGLSMPNGSDWPLSLNGTDALTVSCADSVVCHAAGYFGHAWAQVGTVLSPSWIAETTGTGQELDVMDCFYLADQRCHTLGQNTTLAWASTSSPTPGKSTYSQTVLADAPLRYYRLNEPGGPKAFDSAPAPADGAYQLPMVGGTGADNYQPGVSGPIIGDSDSALGLIGRTDTWVNLPATVDLAGDFSLEGWVNLVPGKVGSVVSMFGRAGAGNDVHFGGADCGAGRGRLRLFDGTVDQVVANSCEAGGAWSYYVITRSAGVVSLYRDGALEATGAAPWAGTFSVSRLGYGNAGAGLYGSFGQMAIYTEALKPAAVRAHYYASGRVEQFPLSAPLSGGWQVTKGPANDPNVVYFTEGTKLARFDPATDTMTEYPAPGGASGLSGVASSATRVYYASYGGGLYAFDPVSHLATLLPPPVTPSNITDVKVGSDGAVYFGESSAHRVGRFDPLADTMSESNVVPPFGFATCQVWGLAESAGRIYFTNNDCPELGSVPLGVLTGVTPATFQHTMSGCGALFMALGSDGLLHFACNSTLAIGTLHGADPLTATISFMSVPAAAGAPAGIDSNPDGNLYYNGGLGGGPTATITRLNVRTNEQTVFTIASPSNVLPFGLATGPDGKIYSVENQGDKLDRLNPP